MHSTVYRISQIRRTSILFAGRHWSTESLTARLARRTPLAFAAALVALMGAGTTYAAAKPPLRTDLFQMELEALMDLRITHAAGLTQTDARRLPVAVTKLGHREIAISGATDLNRLLELLVPNAQFIDHHHLQPHLGFRGIISDREDKYLYQVNGRTMNNWMLLGADNERALPLFGDIQTVNVVRGPASATHGPGAVAGVIDVDTFTGLTFQGSDLTLRHGIGNDHTAAEIRHGQTLAEGRGVFVYYGVARVEGADADYYIGRSFPATNGLPANVAGQPSLAPKTRLGAAGYDNLWHKLHLSYVHGPFEVWGRFVQDGGEDRPMREIYTSPRPGNVSLAEWTRGRQFRSRQWTVDARWHKELTPHFALDLAHSYDVWAFQDERAGVYRLPLRDAHEREHNTRAVGRWTPHPGQSLAFGVERSAVRFHDPSYSDALDRAPAVTQRDWDVDMLSLFAEQQWSPAEQWTTFLSFRADKHTFSDWLTSPRATVVFTPTANDTFKLMAGQAVRRGGDEELWSQFVRSGTIPEPESLRSYEFSYQRRANERWQIGGSAFYQDYDAIGWIPSLYYSSSIGRFGIGGAELELAYTFGDTRITFSEGWSKLLRASLPLNAPAAGQAITAQPYGFGNDLAEWAPFITKLAVTHEFSPRWTGTFSAVHYSGFPGARDYANYAATFPNPPSAVPVSDAGYTEPYGPNLYVNLGVEFRPSPRWSVRVDAHNLAAAFDETLSKRNYYFRLSEFSVQPASVTLRLQHRF